MMKIEMIGYNDTKAIAIYGAIRLMNIVIISFIISLLFIVPAFVYRIYELLYIFIFPVFMIILIILQYFLNSNYKTYLKGIKTKHNFCLDSGILYKDGKEIRNKDDIRIYKFKHFLFLELKKSYYRIMDSDYLTGSREELLSHIRFKQGHYISFVLPPKPDQEIIDLLFNRVNLDGKERLFYSKDKTKIIYIYKNIAGSYSIGEERLCIADEEERRYLHEYGWWEPSWGSGFASFYGTVEEAFRDIETDIRDYIELK